MIVECPNCHSKVVTPSGIPIDAVECAICQTEIDVPLQSAEGTTQERHVSPAWTIVGGRVGRHQRFNDRLVKGAFFLFVVLMAASIVAYEQMPGAVPWWRDVLFFTLGPVAAIGLIATTYSIVSRIHARVTGLTCPFCKRTLAGVKSMSALGSGRCPHCQRDLDVTLHT